MMRIKDIADDTHGHKRLAKLFGMKADDERIKKLCERLGKYDDENAPVGKERILISCVNGCMALVDKKYFFLKTSDIETLKTCEIMEKIDSATLANICVPEFLLRLTQKRGRDNVDIKEGHVIRAARQQIVEEGLYMDAYGYWMQLLYRPYDFQYLVGQLFQTNRPDADRLWELYCKFKKEFAENYQRNRTKAEEREIKILIKCNKKYPDVFVLDHGKRREIDEYTINDLICMKIGRLPEPPSEEMLVWILCYILYPIRMHRLSKITAEEETEDM